MTAGFLQPVPRGVAGPSLTPAELDAKVAAPSRLAAVERSGLLGTPPEEAFDSLTRLARLLLKVPASFVSVVAADHDYYKSQTGVPEPLAHGRRLEGRTFCHHALAADQALVINDTWDHEAWRAVASVRTLGVRAYAGIPMRIGDETIGSFCAIDTEPRDWSAEDLAVLTQLAVSAGREIKLRLALREANDAVTRMEALVRAKEETVAVVSHDLRTPLQVLGLNLKLLEPTFTTEAQRGLARRMSAATETMRHLADELLAAHATPPVAGGEPRPVQAARLVSDVVDYAQMLRIFCNLVGNSIKYCPSGSTVLLTAERVGERVEFKVEDDGPGMTPDDAGRAFERGWQGADGLARNDGAGLGLAIVHRLVEQNAGTVELTSLPGRGTTVRIGVPLRGTPTTAV